MVAKAISWVSLLHQQRGRLSGSQTGRRNLRRRANRKSWFGGSLFKWGVFLRKYKKYVVVFERRKIQIGRVFAQIENSHEA